MNKEGRSGLIPYSGSIPVAILVIFVCLLYWNSLYGNFVWDDRTYFIDNDILPNLKPWDMREIFLQPSNYWGEHLPVRDFLYVAQYNLFGLNPLGYHFVSIGLYVLVCVMAHILLGNIYRAEAAGPGFFGVRGNDVSRMFITLLFASHPVHVEGVAYISGQKDLLCSMLSLTALHAFAVSFRSSDSRRFIIAAGILAYYLALLSKLTAFALTLLVPLLYALSDRTKRPRFRKSLVIWTLANIPAVLWVLWYMKSIQPYWGSTSAITTPPLVERLIAAVKVLGSHTALALKPYPLSFGYPFSVSTSFDINLLIGLVTLAVLAFLVLFFRKDPVIPLAVGIFLLFLLPVLQLHGSLNNASIYDRYLFMPVLGIAMLLERFLRYLPLALNRLRAAYLSIMSSAVVIFTILTISYIPAFRDDIASTRNTYERFPEWPNAAFNYVYSLIEGGRLDEAFAVTEKEKTLALTPWVRGYFRGWIHLERGMIDEAISELRMSSILAVTGGYFPYPNIPLARALVLAGKESEAGRTLQYIFNSPIYQPLEVYQAKKLREEISRQ